MYACNIEGVDKLSPASFVRMRADYGSIGRYGPWFECMTFRHICWVHETKTKPFLFLFVISRNSF